MQFFLTFPTYDCCILYVWYARLAIDSYGGKIPHDTFLSWSNRLPSIVQTSTALSQHCTWVVIIWVFAPSATLLTLTNNSAIQYITTICLWTHRWCYLVTIIITHTHPPSLYMKKEIFYIEWWCVCVCVCDNDCH